MVRIYTLRTCLAHETGIHDLEDRCEGYRKVFTAASVTSGNNSSPDGV
jgi:hypothetical protein